MSQKLRTRLHHSPPTNYSRVISRGCVVVAVVVMLVAGPVKGVPEAIVAVVVSLTLDDDIVALGGVADVAIAAVDNALIAKWVRI